MPLFSRRASGATTQLQRWAASRRGIEAFIEPANAQHPLSLLLVAHDGESIRRPIGTVKKARTAARNLEVPIYDVLAVGYPKRMREYATRGKASAPPPRPAASSTARKTFDPQLVAVLARYAGLETVPLQPDEADLRALFRRARSQVHPDRTGGDRTGWDAVEQAAKALGLPD